MFGHQLAGSLSLLIYYGTIHYVWLVGGGWGFADVLCQLEDEICFLADV